MSAVRFEPMTKSCHLQVSQMLCQLTYRGQLEYNGTNDCFLIMEAAQMTKKTNCGGGERDGQM